VPAAEVDNPAIATSDGAWSVLVVPDDAASAFTAYDDTRFAVTPSAEVIAIVHDGPARATRFEVIAAPPLGVLVDGVLVQQADDVAALDELAAGWTVDGDAVLVQHEHPGGAVTIELRYDELPDTGGSDADGTAGEGGTAATSADEGVGSATAASSGADEDTDDEGAANDDGGGDGCGCATDRPPNITVWSVLGLMALGRRSRRPDQGRARVRSR